IDRFYSRLGYVENQRRKAAGKPLLVKSAMLGSADRFDNTLSHVDVDQKLMWLPRGFQFSPQMQGPMTTEQIVMAVFGEEHTAASEADMKDMEVIMKSQPFITWVKYHLEKKVQSANPATGNGARECSVTLDQFCDKLRNQRGRCFYSDHPFFWPKRVNEINNHDKTSAGNYAVMSLERLDNDKEYTDENTVVVIRVLNTAWTFTRAELVQIKAACKAKAGRG
ncbi:hypothetical protein ScalyP_jg111, partial [Parmales sp. scaly parma]